MDNTAITKEKKKATTTIHEIAHTDSELQKVGMYTTAAFAVAVGIWGMVCLSSAMIKNGSPLEMIKNLFQAITGG